VALLLAKYGAATDDYFSEASYERFKRGEIKRPSKRPITRASEGLYVHHIDEDKIVGISRAEYIKDYDTPYAYQKKERLVYADLIEHGILHILIGVTHPKSTGYLGYVKHIRPEIYAMLVMGTEPKRQYLKDIKAKIFMSKEDAVQLMHEMDQKLIAECSITQTQIDQLTSDTLHRYATHD
jgi:hypothetical protein